MDPISFSRTKFLEEAKQQASRKKQYLGSAMMDIALASPVFRDAALESRGSDVDPTWDDSKCASFIDSLEEYADKHLSGWQESLLASLQAANETILAHEKKASDIKKRLREQCTHEVVVCHQTRAAEDTYGGHCPSRGQQELQCLLCGVVVAVQEGEATAVWKLSPRRPVQYVYCTGPREFEVKVLNAVRACGSLPRLLNGMKHVTEAWHTVHGPTATAKLKPFQSYRYPPPPEE